MNLRIVLALLPAFLTCFMAGCAKIPHTGVRKNERTEIRLLSLEQMQSYACAWSNATGSALPPPPRRDIEPQKTILDSLFDPAAAGKVILGWVLSPVSDWINEEAEKYAASFGSTLDGAAFWNRKNPKGGLDWNIMMATEPAPEIRAAFTGIATPMAHWYGIEIQRYAGDQTNIAMTATFGIWYTNVTWTAEGAFRLVPLVYSNGHPATKVTQHSQVCIWSSIQRLWPNPKEKLSTQIAFDLSELGKDSDGTFTRRDIGHVTFGLKGYDAKLKPRLEASADDNFLKPRCSELLPVPRKESLFTVRVAITEADLSRVGSGYKSLSKAVEKLSD